MTGQSLHAPDAATARRWPLQQPVQVNDALRLEDRSWRARFGCKGPQAESWLAAQGLGVPPAANSAQVNPDGILVARLARTEFLIEALRGGFDSVAAITRQLQRSAPPSGVYPVTRQDVVIDIDGAGCNELLRQICSVDFSSLLATARADGGPVVLTSMVGVSVVAWPHLAARAPAITLWFDPSFGHYFCSTLLEVGGGIGGEFSAGREQ